MSIKRFLIYTLCLTMLILLAGCESTFEANDPVLPITKITPTPSLEAPDSSDAQTEPDNILNEYVTIIYTVNDPDTLHAMKQSSYWGGFSEGMPDSLTVNITNQYFPDLTAVSIVDAHPSGGQYDNNGIFRFTTVTDPAVIVALIDSTEIHWESNWGSYPEEVYIEYFHFHE